MILFGDNGLNVANAAEMTTEEILALNEAMLENGLITTEQAEKATELNSTMNDLKMQFAAAAAELAVALMPAILALTDFLKTTVIPVLNAIAKWFGGLSPEQQKMLMWLLFIIILLPKIIAIITTLIGIVKAITVALYGTAAGAGAVSAAASPLLPIMWAVAAVVLILVLLFAALAGKSKDVTNQLKQQQDQMRSMQDEYSDMGADFEITSSQISSNHNTDKLEIHVQIDAVGDTAMSQENAELVADLLAERINKQLGGKI